MTPAPADPIAQRFELDYKPILSRADATAYEKQLVADINTLLVRGRRLTDALRRHGDHSRKCMVEPCSCGFTRALAEGESDE